MGFITLLDMVAMDNLLLLTLVLKWDYSYQVKSNGAHLRKYLIRQCSFIVETLGSFLLLLDIIDF